MKDRKETEGLLTENDFFNETGLDEKTRAVYEREGFLAPVQITKGIKYYSAESADFAKAIKRYTAKGLPLHDAYEMVIQGVSSKKRRTCRAVEEPLKTIDPRKIELHRNFEGFLEIDAELQRSITADMAANGYYESMPVVLATWPGQEDPVLIDGHTRVYSSIDAGIKKIFFVVEEFEDEGAALLHAMNLQAKRRTTSDWVLFQLIGRFDKLMAQGGDRRSEQAKSNPPRGGLENKKQTSAERTAATVGCSPRTVERARRIRKKGTTDLIEALKNGKTMSQVENIIAQREKAEKETEEESQVEKKESLLDRLTDANRSDLMEVGGDLYVHVNRALKGYFNYLRKNNLFPEKK